ncbi:CYTH domain-containing protein [methane-oxidizing endosymbiont of Gigantopelta aegis]|uniref:CYTH domain-containing protein n=1 Tax=methane-oxidizing endosymbiont of Gigantopelta aegis TaxID=2794938 RepID=UPI0018DD6C54|nr:CYTH domain-containing protein [methane-oxidizing endosymbiont of Gigantopelta aegis]
MALEIEHKFLLKNDNWRQHISHSVRYRQGYLCGNDKTSIRVRTSDTDAWLNIKSATIGNHRQEFEYSIPLADAEKMLETLCHRPLIEKTRYFVNHDQHVWEIDEFTGDNAGLIVAEVELQSLEEKFSLPDWIGEEVTHDLRYYNNNLCKNPYKNWK